MSEIQIPDIARKIARRFGIDGYSPAPTLAPEIVPVVTVADLGDATEEDTGFQRACISNTQQAAVAGEYSHTMIFNPTDSGVICMVEAVIASLSAAGTIRWGRYASELTTGLSAYFRDIRIRGAPAIRPSRDSDAAALGSTYGSAQVATAADSVQIPLDFKLPEGYGLVMRPAAVNVELNVCWFWQERNKLPGE